MKRLGWFVVLVLVFAGVLTLTQYGRASNPAEFTLSMTSMQVGSPVKLVSTMSTAAAGYESVVVQSHAKLGIRAITFGAVLHPNGQAKEHPTLIVGQAVATDLAANSTMSMRCLALDNQTMKKAIRQCQDGVIAELGVLKVEFSDGSQWSFDPMTRGRFRADDTPFVARSAACKSRSRILTLFAAGGDDYGDRCKDVDGRELCTNYGDHCDSSECPAGPPGDCAKQTCSHIIAD